MTHPKEDLGLKAIDEAEVLATKIGGQNALRFKTNLARAKARKAKGQAQIMVVSALRTHPLDPKPFSTTDELLKLVSALRSNNEPAARELLKGIRDFHIKVIHEEVEAEAQPLLIFTLDRELERFTNTLAPLFRGENLNQLQALGVDWVYSTERLHQSLTGFGEELCRELYASYFEHHGLSTRDLKKNEVTELVYKDNPKEALNNRNALETLRDSYAHQIHTILEEDSTALILEGGHQALRGTKRGYSDTSTAEMARAAAAGGRRTVMNEEKQTSIKTRNGKDGRVVRQQSPALLGELIGARGAEAGVVQSQVTGILRGTNVSMVVHDPDAPENGSTYIPFDGDLSIDEQEIIAPKKTKTVLKIEGDMAQKKGVLALITNFLRTSNIDQTFSTRDTVTLTLDSEIDAKRITDLEGLLQARYQSPFKVLPQEKMGLVFALGGSHRFERKVGEGQAVMENRIAEPPFGIQLVKGGTEGEALPYAFTVEGPMSDAPGVLALITDQLQEYNIDQTFSTENTWTVTLDKALSESDAGALRDALTSHFGNGWQFSEHEDLRIRTQTEGEAEHPVWTLLQNAGIKVHYMHAIPERGVTVVMVPQELMSATEDILHNFHYAA